MNPHPMNAAMKTSAPSAIRKLAARVHATGRGTRRNVIAGALSLCLVAGIAAVISGFSQDAGQGNTAAADAAIDKPSVLFLTPYNQGEYADCADTVEWLAKAGFDVTIALTHDPSYDSNRRVRAFKAPQDQKIVVINQLDAIDSHDVLWVMRADPKRDRVPAPDRYPVINRWEKSGKPLVIDSPLHLAAPEFHTAAITDLSQRQMLPDDGQNFVKRTGNWIFYNDSKQAELAGKTREQTLDSLRAMLTGDMHAARTITDLKGRSMKGVVLGKSDTAITFERLADKKRFEIKLDTLCETDRALLANLPNMAAPTDAATPSKRAVLLFVPRNETYADSADTVEWLTKAGFDVTIALAYDPTSNYVKGWVFDAYKAPVGQKVLVLNRLETIDRYDVVWFLRFPWIRCEVPALDRYAVVNHREKSGKPLVSSCHCPEAGDPDWHRKGRGPSVIRGKADPKNFVKVSGNWLFYGELLPDPEGKTRAKVLEKIHELL